MDNRTYTRGDIENRLRAIIVDRIGVEPVQVQMDTNLYYDLGCDSLDVVEITMDVEKEFGISVEVGEEKNFEKFGGGIAFIETKLAEGKVAC